MIYQQRTTLWKWPQYTLNIGGSNNNDKKPLKSNYDCGQLLEELPKNNAAC